MKPSVDVILSGWFTRRMKKLRKRYPRIQQDIQPLIEQLERGDVPGDRIPAKNRIIYKVRLPNRDARRGKSGGYRVIYYSITEDRITLLTIYTKSDSDTISLGKILALIADLPENDDE
jgi:mRNA-degrading endonuclease RelE of RelBE toxin-antitoxin system